MTNHSYDQFDEKHRNGRSSAILTPPYSWNEPRRGANSWLSLGNPRYGPYVALDANSQGDESDSDNGLPELVADNGPAVNFPPPEVYTPYISDYNNRYPAEDPQLNLRDGPRSPQLGHLPRLPPLSYPPPKALTIMANFDIPVPEFGASTAGNSKPKESESAPKDTEPRGSVSQVSKPTTRDIVYRFGVMPMLGATIFAQIYKLTENSVWSAALWCIVSLFGIDIATSFIKLLFFRVPPRDSSSNKDFTKLLTATGYQVDDRLAMPYPFLKNLDPYTVEDDTQCNILDIPSKALDMMSQRLGDLQPTRSVTVREIGNELLIALLRHEAECLRNIATNLTRMTKCFKLVARRIANKGLDKRPLAGAELTFRKEIRSQEQTTKFWLSVFLYALLQTATIYQNHQTAKVSVAPVEVNTATVPDQTPALLAPLSYLPDSMALYIPQLSLPTVPQIFHRPLPTVSLNSVPSFNLADLKARLFSVNTPPPPVETPAPQPDLTTIAGVQAAFKKGALAARGLAGSFWRRTKEVSGSPFASTPEVFVQLSQDK
ncbi:hypothetical protein F5Y18DRAFT_444573 [Xylariaceae sp. FL1019]|nr:hypothetical protein F5Y18DRAFT_444573 [Xylariaceae sp. FL1019]